MKKILLVILVLILTSCTIVVENSTSSSSSGENIIKDLTIFTINDMHGAIEEKDGKGFAYISGYIDAYKEKYDGEVIFLGNGDLLQGTAISYLSFGSTVIEALNMAGLDAFTIGNHEFDWGIEVIESFVDGSNEWNVKANFPFLGANIYEKATNKRPDWLESYTIIEKGDISIGIIGTIGESLESSINPARVNDYEFVDAVPLISNIAKDLRVNKKVDTVIVLAHDADDSFNTRVSSLTGDSLVDAVINGHTHYRYTKSIERNNYPSLPVIQSGANGDFLGKITLKVNTTKNKIISSSMTNINVRNIADDYEVNKEVSDYIKAEAAKVDPIVSEVLGTAGRTLQKADVLTWVADVMKKSTGAEITFINDGAFRNGIVIYKGEEITFGTLFEMLPFDNIIKMGKIKGSYLKNFYDQSSTGMVFNSGFSTIDINKTYQIAAVDYVFDKTYNPFLSYGTDIQNTQIFVRDLLIEDIKSYTAKGLQFNP